MPGMDGTGPFGDGRPGRGLGPCARIGFGRGFGRRFRGRLGFRSGVNSAVQPSETSEFYSYDKKTLETKKAELEKQLQWTNEQLQNLKEEE